MYERLRSMARLQRIFSKYDGVTECHARIYWQIKLGVVDVLPKESRRSKGKQRQHGDCDDV